MVTVVPPKGYCTQAAIEALLGRPLTAAELAALPQVLAVAEAWIDGFTARAWDGGPVVDEAYEPDGLRLYLKAAPVRSVEAVTLPTALDGTVTALTVGTQYGLLDPQAGLLVLASRSGWGSAWPWPPRLVLVSYTPSDVLPAPIAAAAATGCALQYQQAASGVGFGVAGQRRTVADITVDTRYHAESGGGGSGGGPSPAPVPYAVRVLLEPLCNAARYFA